MKRRGAKTQDQPVVKKPDANVSTDLRSKIGAKLQTLLNGITTDSDLFIKSKRQLYADLFKEPQYSEIIIDPNIVVKIEDPDSEQSGDNVSEVPSENFLSSAKSQITELLKKPQDSEKENSVNANECTPSTSLKSKSLPISSGPSRGWTKSSSTTESSNASHSDVLINQGQIQNACVVEDCVKTGRWTKHTRLLRHESKKCQTGTSTTSKKKCPIKKALVKHRQNAIKAKQTVTTGEIVTNSELNNVVSNIVRKRCSTTNSKLPKYSTVSSKKPKHCRKNVSSLNSSYTSRSSSCIESATVVNQRNFNINESANLDISDAVGDSEIVDDPEVCLTVEENMELVLNDADCENIPDGNTLDPDVVLLCEKRPTYDIITLEEDENSVDLVEEVQRCNQCGKTFRAKSLLNFHLRMHGSDSAAAAISSSSILSDSITSRKS